MDFFINVPVAFLSVFMTNKFVENSPRQEQETRDLRAHASEIDYVGFALTALCFGTLEIVLDKGQEDDWFGSPFIKTLVVVCATAFVGLIAWEWWQAKVGRKPVIDLSVFQKKSFLYRLASCSSWASCSMEQLWSFRSYCRH